MLLYYVLVGWRYLFFKDVPLAEGKQLVLNRSIFSLMDGGAFALNDAYASDHIHIISVMCKINHSSKIQMIASLLYLFLNYCIYFEFSTLLTLGLLTVLVSILIIFFSSFSYLSENSTLLVCKESSFSLL